jgi:hypothetical protein
MDYTFEQLATAMQHLYSSELKLADLVRYKDILDEYVDNPEEGDTGSVVNRTITGLCYYTDHSLQKLSVSPYDLWFTLVAFSFVAKQWDMCRFPVLGRTPVRIEMARALSCELAEVIADATDNL